MPIQVDSKISVMDIFAITVAALSGVWVVFGVQGGVDHNTQEIVHIKDDIKRLDKNIEREIERVGDAIDAVHENVERTRTESAESRLRIERKLDKLIEREIDGMYNGKYTNGASPER